MEFRRAMAVLGVGASLAEKKKKGKERAGLMESGSASAVELFRVSYLVSRSTIVVMTDFPMLRPHIHTRTCIAHSNPPLEHPPTQPTLIQSQVMADAFSDWPVHDDFHRRNSAQVLRT